ncbi:MAG: glycosyltransferase [Chloroflexales bacterium]|nr:glycosyltransferase [Chloroflexales bacterium]
MRVLFVAPYVPSRIRVRPYHLLRELVAHGHEVTLVCPARGADDARGLAELRSLCARVVAVPVGRLGVLRNYLQALPGQLPLQASHALDAELVAAVARELAANDIVHIEHLRASQVALAARALAGAAPPFVLDSVDCISLLFERAIRHSPSTVTRCIALADLARTRRYEAAYGRRFERILVTSPEDRWALGALAEPGLTKVVSVVPNGVDLAYFAPRDLPRDHATIVFTGKMSYHANHAAALFLVRELMPLIWRELPETRVLIVGAGPGPAIRALAGDGRVYVTGFVPDLRPYLAQATLAVSPIRYGVGVQNKVLEALAMGTPVVTARQAIAALTAVPEQDLLVGSSTEDFARQILRLLNDPVRQRELGARGRGYVERNHQWTLSLHQLEHVYSAARGVARPNPISI